MLLFIQLSIICLSIPLYLLLGRAVSGLLARIALIVSPQEDSIPSFSKNCFAGQSETEQPRFVYFILGLLFHLYFSFLLRSMLMPWTLSALLPLLPVLLIRRAQISGLLAIKLEILSLNFVLWSVVVMILGASLLDFTDEISTPWINNYGDLAFHLGMISSFVFGENFPPEYHIYPGELLSYPLLVNYWTSLYWLVFPRFETLGLIFFFQWTTLWTVLFFALRGNHLKLLPWLVLLGGGSYELFLRQVIGEGGSEFSTKLAHSFISEGHPWAPFISTIWVTQRPTLLGVAALTTALALYHQTLRPPNDKTCSEQEREIKYCTQVIHAGAVLSLAVLAHVHFALVGTLYLGLDLFFRGLFSVTGEQKRLPALRALALFFLPFVISLFALPWLLGKVAILSFTAGWMSSPDSAGIFSSLSSSAEMWCRNAPLWLAMLFVLAKYAKRQFLVIAILFILGNVLQMAVWQWDQIKFFIALYICSISLLSYSPTGQRYLLKALLLLMLVPAAYEVSRVFYSYRDYTVYSKADLGVAKSIITHTPANAVIAAKAEHNSPVTLSGRRLYAGYAGTLASHGLDYAKREGILKDLSKLANCRELSSALDPCPSYLLWTEREKNLYHKETPDAQQRFHAVYGDTIYAIEQTQ